MNRLKELRKEGNLTQEELANIIGVTKRTIISWEKEDRTIKTEKAQQLANFFYVSIPYLLGYSTFRDGQEALQKIYTENSKDDYALVKSRIIAILGDSMLEIVEKEYIKGTNDDPDFSHFLSLLSALRVLTYTDEEKLLLNYAILPKDEKNIINNLVSDMSNRVKKEIS